MFLGINVHICTSIWIGMTLESGIYVSAIFFLKSPIVQNPIFMSFILKHVSPRGKETLKVSGGKNVLSFFLIHLYKTLSENELIRFWPLYDVIT